MNLTQEQRNTIAKILQLTADKNKLAVYIFGLEESFDTLKNSWNELQKTVQEYMDKESEDDSDESEIDVDEIVEKVLGKIEPQTFDDSAITSKILEEVKNGEFKLSEKVKQDISNLEAKIASIVIPESFDPTTLESKWNTVIAELDKKISDIKPFELKGEDIVDKVNELPIQEEDQIDFKHIKGWKDTIGDFVRTLGLGGRTVGGARSGGMGVYKLVLNGVTKSFTIPNFRGGDIAILGSSFPTAFAKTTDYTVNGNVITFTDEIDASTTLSNGQTIIVIYNQLFFTK